MATTVDDDNMTSFPVVVVVVIFVDGCPVGGGSLGGNGVQYPRQPSNSSVTAVEDDDGLHRTVTSKQ